MPSNRFLLVEQIGDQIKHLGEVDSEESIPELIQEFSSGRGDYVLRPVTLSKSVESVMSVRKVFWIEGQDIEFRGSYVFFNKKQALVPTGYLLLEVS